MSQFPKYKYHAELDPIVVEDEDEESSLSDEWADSPAEHGVITAPSVEQGRKMRLEAASKPKSPAATPAEKRAATIAAKKALEAAQEDETDE